LSPKPRNRLERLMVAAEPHFCCCRARFDAQRLGRSFGILLRFEKKKLIWREEGKGGRGVKEKGEAENDGMMKTDMF